MEFVAFFFLTVWADFLLIWRVVVSESFGAERLGFETVELVLVLVVWYGRVVLGSGSRDSAGMRVGWFVSGGVEGLFL